MSIDNVITLIVALIGSGIINAVLQRIWSVKDSNKETIQRINEKIDEIKSSVDDIGDRLSGHIRSDDERDAIQCRTRIHRFNDELLHGDKHTKEHFDSILLDCTRYNCYCREHKEFSNEITIAAEKHIKCVYDRCLIEHSFM